MGFGETAPHGQNRMTGYCLLVLGLITGFGETTPHGMMEYNL